LTALPDDTAVWPTHGAGSFCSAPPGAERTTTIGAQKATNTLLATPDENTFVQRLLVSLGSYPAYFDRLAQANRHGPALLPAAVDLAPLTAAMVRSLLGQGGQLVDVRPVTEFAAGHIPGAVSIPLRDAFATWLGWLLPPDMPLVFVLGPGQDPAEVVWQAAKIGYDHLAGRLAGGVDAWRADGGSVQTVELVTADRIGDRPVVDVRQQAEYTAGHIPGARHAELGTLSQRPEAAPKGAVVMCGHGERAMTGASLLARGGVDDLAVLAGGPADWATATGRLLEKGP
jgi:rhodanese-related sulfurtransferase